MQLIPGQIQGKFDTPAAPTFSLKRLPLWGEQVAPHEIEFQWPMQEMLANLAPDVHLHSINFKGNPQVVAVRVQLSDSQASP